MNNRYKSYFTTALTSLSLGYLLGCTSPEPVEVPKDITIEGTVTHEYAYEESLFSKIVYENAPWSSNMYAIKTDSGKHYLAISLDLQVDPLDVGDIGTFKLDGVVVIKGKPKYYDDGVIPNIIVSGHKLLEYNLTKQ